jgi:protein-S-isoprenylcysteine O-methyltransferase Ste14
MRKFALLLGSILFFLVAPATVAGYVPYWLTGFRFEPAWFPGARVFGAVLIAAGLIPTVESFIRFALKGLGTPAPILPPQRLVVSGFYRYVRNPMYVGVVAVIIGETLLFARPSLAFYAAGVWLAFHLFVVLYEEPALRRKFGDDYATYCRHVGRWIPRLTPWRVAPP